MKQWLLVCLLMLGVVFHASGQGPRLDYGVASEMMRSMVSGDFSQNILGSTNLMANYRNLALEQEMAQEAARRGLTERIDVRRAVEDSRRDILIRALRIDVVKQAKPPTDAEIEKEFAALSDKLILPAGFKLDVYTIPASQTQILERAKALLAEDAGASQELIKRGFTHVTAQMSEPWFGANQVSPAIWKQLEGMANGHVAYFPDGGNYLLVRRLDARDSRPATMDEAREQIRGKLLNEAQEKLWSEFISKRANELGL